jgi:hypothetical protein
VLSIARGLGHADLADDLGDHELVEIVLAGDVGFEAEGQHIGLVPGGGPQGMTSPVAYWHVPDLEAKPAKVTAAGATVKEPVRDVGGGRLVATVTDPDGSVLGLLQDQRVGRGRTWECLHRRER